MARGLIGNDVDWGIIWGMLALVLIANIILVTGVDQFYKLTTRTMKNAAAQTVGIQSVAALSCLVLVPFFEWRLPSEPLVYLFLTLSCVFYALNNRILADVRKNLDVSVISVLKQSYTALMALAGFVLLGETVTVLKVLGVALIIGGNALVFWQGKAVKKKKFGILAYACNVVAGLLDMKSSGKFNLPFYTVFLYMVPAMFIFIGSRLRISDVVKEFKRANKKHYLLTGVCWGVQYLLILVAYAIGGGASVVAPITSLVAFTDLIVAYFWLGERDAMGKKFIAALLAILGVVFISI